MWPSITSDVILNQMGCRRTCALNKKYFFITEKKENVKVESLNYANCEINKCTEMQIAFVYLRGLNVKTLEYI